MTIIGAREAAKLRRPIKEEWQALKKRHRVLTRQRGALLQNNTADWQTLINTAEWKVVNDEFWHVHDRMRALEEEFEKYIVYGEKIDTPIR